LAKTVTDKTKISEEIDSKLVTHNEDPSAHKQTGEAIDTHRVAEILDHLDKSVQVDKLAFDRYLISPSFESLDGWNTWAGGTGATITPHIGSCFLRTGNAIGDITKIWIEGIMENVLLANNPWFQARLDLDGYPGYQDVAIGVGHNAPWSPVHWFGFRWSKADEKFYANYEGWYGEVKTEIVGYAIGGKNLLRAEMSENGTVIKYYVNDILKVTHTNVQAYLDSYYYFCVASKCQVNGTNAELYIRDIIFSKKW